MHGVAQAQGASVALLYSQTADIWSDGVGTIGAHKKAIYLALRHLQVIPSVPPSFDTPDA